MPLTAASPLTELKGVGPVRARRLAAAGYRSVGSLLRHLPLRYEDRRRLSRVADVAGEGAHTLRGRVLDTRAVRVWRRGLSLVRGTLDDGSGRLPVVWFNRPYLAGQLDPESTYLLHGPVRRRGERLELVNPSCEAAEGAVHAAAVVPVYPAIGELGPAFLRRLFDALLEGFDPRRELADPLPEELRRRYDLPPLGEAVAALHRPGERADGEALNRRATAAHHRLVYGELLEMQLELGLRRRRVGERPKPHRYRLDAGVRRRLAGLAPFRLTGAQERVIGEILADLESPRPMRRLLQGDVGCGKTIVAATAMVAAAESGLQAALMAPTEILAEQHRRTLGALLGDRYRIGLVTAGAPGAAADRERLASGELDLVVGTHALVQEAVRFGRQGLAIVDEQHRFGVAQRQALTGKGEHTDLLVMTATPIPRSLALTLYGDLDVSLLDEMPPGRSPVRTEVRPVARREETYDWLEGRLAQGGRAYVVLPLIEESDAVEAASIERHGAELAERLSAFEPRIVHGRTPAEERARSLEEFAAGRSRVLIATTVIEVGLDVPAASLLVIENAERFGLAQLHQLRGRVGRGGGEPAHCVALHGELGEEGRRRLEVFAASRDGFEIAEADLELRGPGDLLGTRQAGLPALFLADLAAHRRWVERAHADARELLERRRDPAAAAVIERARRRAGRRSPEEGEARCVSC
ncbi:MAG: ATP-dependent DNA helicase RecG [Thermoanaerobaculia bacterium]|nr:ATP-dependent DNA helicase RecG [Thermoanaerobaculia bacterium]